jgi:CHASE3 domain sensor protein
MSRQTARQDPQQVAIGSVRRSSDRTAAVVSAIALIFSAYSLWESSLKSPSAHSTTATRTTGAALGRVESAAQTASSGRE